MSNEYNDENLNENLNDPIKKVSLEDSESVVNEYNDTNLNENLNDPVEKVSLETSSKSPQSGNDPAKKVSTNTKSNNFIPRLPSINIAVQIEKVFLKESESISEEYINKDPVTLENSESVEKFGKL